MSDTYYEDLTVGAEITPLVKGPISTAHIMRWSAAIENWGRIHYDWPYATTYGRLPGVMVNGTWKQHILIQLLTDWVGESGWLWKMAFQFRAMNVAGDTLTAWGKITAIETRGAYGLVTLAVGLRNQDGTEGTPGNAVVVVRRRGGPAVPYPFDAECLA